MVPLPPFAFFVALAFCFPIRRLGCSVYRSHARCNAKAKAEHRQPGRDAELAVQPAPPEQPDEHTEAKFEPQRRVAGQAFPVLLHSLLA